MMRFSGLIVPMLHRYEAQHPNIRIKWVDVPFSEGEKKALTSMLGPQPPDVINLNPDFSATLASRDALLDLNQWLTPQQRRQYVPVSLQAATLQGRLFGLPWYLSSAVTLYNAALFQQAGIASPPNNNEQLATLAQQLYTRTGKSLLMPALGAKGQFFRMLLKAGVPIWDTDQKHVVFADHGAGAALAFWTQLYRQGLIPQESLSEDAQTAVDRYQSGALGMMLTGPNFLTLIQENAPGIYKDTQIAPQFPAKSDVVDFSEMLFVIPKRSAHPREAVDLALYLTNVQNTLALSRQAPVLPTQTQALMQPAFRQLNSADKLLRGKSISARQLLQAKSAYKISPQQNALNQLMDYYVQAVLLGRLSPDTAMHRAQTAMNQLLQGS